MSAATEHFLEVALDAVALHVELEASDGALALVVCLAHHRCVVDDVSLAVVIEEETGVDAVDLTQINRFAPSLQRVFRLHIEVACPYIGGNHIEGLVLLVVADGWRIDAARHMLPLERHLRRTVEYMARRSPVDQVLAGGEGYAGEEGKGRVDEIVGVAHAADARIGIEARQYRVVILVGLVDGCAEAGIVARILEVVELGGLCLCHGGKSKRKG